MEADGVGLGAVASRWLQHESGIARNSVRVRYDEAQRVFADIVMCILVVAIDRVRDGQHNLVSCQLIVEHDTRRAGV